MTNDLPRHFMISDSGDLLDMRTGHDIVARPGYAHCHRSSESIIELKSTLRSGPYAWPGGYPKFLLLESEGCFCWSCGRKRFEELCDYVRDGKAVYVDVNYEDTDLHCENCGKPIEAAYVDLDDETDD